MGLFDRFKSGLQKTHQRLVHEIRRIVTRSPKLTADTLEELEAALLSADLGLAITDSIISTARQSFESQGKTGIDILQLARTQIEESLNQFDTTLKLLPNQLTVISIVGVNGTGKTTTSAKLAHHLQQQNLTTVLAACDTFRAAAIEQLKLWGERLHTPVIAGAYGADPAAVGHDAVSAATARNANALIVDTAGRLHTKQNLMQELQKLHRVLAKQAPGAPHETLLVLDGSTGLNALSQAREFHKAVPLTGLVVTKLDGTSKGGAIVAIQKELGIPVKFIGLGEQPDDLQPFNPQAFSQALFED
ncbi:MAG: signal recognition particle-docking protein FtsY [Limisphaerales bacterium]|jgi:fused signal recognition particle receptor